jgi:hypothetical protein
VKPDRSNHVQTLHHSGTASGITAEVARHGDDIRRTDPLDVAILPKPLVAMLALGRQSRPLHCATPRNAMRVPYADDGDERSAV